jgi:hypothetical protein
MACSGDGSPLAGCLAGGLGVVVVVVVVVVFVFETGFSL